MTQPAFTPPLCPSPAQQRLLLGLAGAVFLLGLSVYVLARDTALLPAWAGPQPLQGLLPPALSNSLPSYCHTCALALATAALGSPAGRTCASWCACNAGLEAAQWAGVQTWWPPQAPAWLAWLVRGHFDLLDLAAVLLGAGTAWVVLHHFRQQARHLGEEGP